MPFPISSSLLDAIVLSIVAREDTYGYRITQDVRQVMEVSDSTLYPVLRRLLKDGCLTPPGRMRLDEALRDWAAYRDSIEKVFFGG